MGYLLLIVAIMLGAGIPVAILFCFGEKIKNWMK